MRDVSAPVRTTAPPPAGRSTESDTGMTTSPLDDRRQQPSATTPLTATTAGRADARSVTDGERSEWTTALLARANTPGVDEAEREALLDLYAPDEGWTEEQLSAFAASEAPARLKAFLPRLRDFV